jgi:fatty acid amide hydrolase
MTNPTAWGAAEIARHIASREISSREVVQAFIERIEGVNGRLNAVVVRRYDAALAEAAAADERLARGEPIGLLHGVPITVKECFHVAGTPATIGLDRRRDEISPDDGLLVRRMKRAGAIILGKTNVPQLMTWYECDNPVYGRTNNPWDLGRTPGGSTGGEAAIIAAHGSPLGLGNDLGGSIRVPCHFCGIHGLKPTSLRLPRMGAVSTVRGLEAIVTQPGPMARHVEDLHLGLKVLADPGDGYVGGDVMPGGLPDPAAIDLRHLRIALLESDGTLPVSAAIQRAVREAADALAARGATIVPFNSGGKPLFPAHEVLEIYCGLMGADGGADARRLAHGSTLDWRVARLSWIAGLRPQTRMAVVNGLRLAGQRWMARVVSLVRPMSADSYRQLAYRKQQFVRQAIDALQRERIDAILCPPHALPATQHVKGFDLLAAASHAMLFNLLGWPAGVVAATRVRAGEDAGRRASRDQVERQAAAVDRGSVGLPVGVQIAALPWREDIVLAVMGALEEHFQQQTAEYPPFADIPAVAIA